MPSRAGEEVLITRRGQPAARLVWLHPGTPRAFGIDRGRLVIPEGFDAPVETRRTSSRFRADAQIAGHRVETLLV